MPINIEQHGDHSQITIDGEMTIFVTQELKESLSNSLKESKEIEVDLSQVTEIDGAGLQLMIAAKLQSIALGKALRFTSHSAPVVSILELSDLSGFFGDPIVMQSEAA